nr:MAG TPA: hypothetical protein [Caudoviricetes sp.]DAX62497.1 MAG TPA: hypothetical protein [Caudoviricetes sp.]
MHATDMQPINRKNGCTLKPLIILTFLYYFYIMQPINRYFLKKY